MGVWWPQYVNCRLSDSGLLSPSLPCGMKRKWIVLLAKVVAGILIGQTLFFKFTGAPESVALFAKLGVEPWGRLFTAVMEAFAVITLLNGAWNKYSGLLIMGIMSGAIMAHFLVLGISSFGDGGLLFFYAWICLICGLIIAYPINTNRLLGKSK